MDWMYEARLCVLCRTRPEDERWRPFCSERCKTADLAQWADGRYRVPGEPIQPADTDADNDVLDPDS